MKKKSMINIELNLCVNETSWKQSLPNNQQISSEVVSLAVNFISQHNSSYIYKLNKPLAFNLCLSNDDEVQSLNYEFRGKNKPTNVLSFANIDASDFEYLAENAPIIEMGDIIIALETMQKEATEKQISLHNHFCHLLTHGVLHLLGYDHIDDKEADIMENLETKILKLLNIDNPYDE